MHRRGAIDRYLAGSLSAAAAERMRAHLRGCARCRDYFDEQVTLLRALAGDTSRPTPAEEARVLRRALEGAGLEAPAAERAPAPARAPAAAVPWARRLALRPVAVAGAVAVILVGFVLWQRLRPAPRTAPSSPSLVAGRTPAAPGGPSPIAPATSAPATTVLTPASAPAAEAVAGRLTRATHTTVDGAPAAKGIELRAGATLAVAPGGHAEVELPRGGHVRLYPRATARLSSRGEEVALEAGKVWCDVDRGRGAFTVRTAEGEARVLGTSFVVERSARGTDVRVMRGTVEVEDAGRRGVVRVQERQRSRIEARRAPERVTRYAPERDRSDWDRMLADLGRALKRTGQAIERGLKSLGEKLR